LVGKSGMEAIAKGFDTVLLLRWNIAPGDAVVLDCTSADPERQFRAWKRWHRHHQDWVIDYQEKKFFWYRPPYPDDELHKLFKILPVTPPNPRMNCQEQRYFSCFDIRPSTFCRSQSM